MASWSLLADFSFSDLLLFVPITGDKGAGGDAAPDFEARFLEEKPFEKPPPGLESSDEVASGPATGTEATPAGATRGSG